MNHGKSVNKNTSFIQKLAFPACVIIILFGVYAFPSSELSDRSAGKSSFAFADDMSAQLVNVQSGSMSEIHELSRVYRLNFNEDPCPVPNPGLFDGNNYEDETIKVAYSQEVIFDSIVHFAEVTIAHPSQIRTAWAGRSVGTSAVFSPLLIAEDINAVVAINGDFAGYRKEGIIIRQGQEVRYNPCGWSALLIDIDGNFHIVPDKEAQAVMDEYNIVNSFAFGPSLVVKGEIEYNLDKSAGDDPPMLNRSLHPRTAIGQLGELRYLLCCVEGRRKETRGVNIEQLAKIMYDKSCAQAYTLDGGQSTSLIINNNLVNIPLWGGNRKLSEILFFATAIPN